MATLLEVLARRKLIVVTGKGGVGKSAIAATLARVLVAIGRQVLLVEVDPRENLHQLLDVPPSGGELVEVSPGLKLQNLEPRRVMDEMVRDHLRLAPVVRRVLASPVYNHFVDGAPGLKELAVLGHALEAVERGHAGRPPWADIVVLDAPASGHSVSLLQAPSLAASVIRHGPVGHMASELSAFIRDETRCGIVVVTVAEEMPVQEAIELIGILRERLDRGAELVIANNLYPPWPATAAARAAARGPGAEVWRRRRAVNERELARLGAAWRGPLVELPVLPLARGPELLAALQQRLLAALVSGAGGPRS